MKKWMAMVLAAAMLAGMTACAGRGAVEDVAAPGPLPVEASLMVTASGTKTVAQEATLTVNGVTYRPRDKVGRLVENGWRVRDNDKKIVSNLESRIGKPFDGIFSLGLVHDDVDGVLYIQFITAYLDNQDTYADAYISQMNLEASMETPWSLSGIVDNTMTMSAIRRLPDVLVADTPEFVLVDFGNYFGYDHSTDFYDNGFTGAQLIAKPNGKYPTSVKVVYNHHLFYKEAGYKMK